MKEIQLTRGLTVKVSDSRFDELNQFSWYALKGKNNFFYAARQDKGVHILMHRLILGLQKGDKRQGDHIDRDTLNNQDNNLRIATSLSNNHNRGKAKIGNAASQYKGVGAVSQTYTKKSGEVSVYSSQKWRAQIKANGKNYDLGMYDLEIDAAKAYDIKAKELFGDFAYLNFP